MLRVFEEGSPGDIGVVRGGKPRGCRGCLRREAPGVSEVFEEGSPGDVGGTCCGRCRDKVGDCRVP